MNRLKQNTLKCGKKVLTLFLCGALVFQGMPPMSILADQTNKIAVIQTPDELQQEQQFLLSEGYQIIGNDPSNIKNGGQVLTASGRTYYVENGQLYYYNTSGDPVKVLSDVSGNLNYSDGQIYYLDKKGFIIKKCSVNGENSSVVYESDKRIDKMYIVDDRYALYTINGELFRYDLKSLQNQTSGETVVADFVPSKEGIVVVKGEMNAYTLIAGGYTYSGIEDYYVADETMQFVKESGNCYISLKNMFSGKQNAMTEGSYGDSVSMSDFMDSLNETDANMKENAIADEGILADPDDGVSLCASAGTSVKLSTGQKNAVSRAYSMSKLTWTPLKTVYGWRGHYTFAKGETYTGTPYGQNISQGTYIGYGISVEGFKAAVKDSKSPFYTSSGLNAYNINSAGEKGTSTYYANDCSSFVSYCWGISRNTCVSLMGKSTKIGKNAYNLQVGDCLNSEDHVVLVTNIKKDSDGNITELECSDQTTPVARTRTFSSVSSLVSKYIDNGYVIYRYSGIDKVPAPEKAEANDSVNELTFTNYTYPTSISEGSSFGLRGTISSNTMIENVKASILNSAGKTIISSSFNPYQYTTDMTLINKEIKFGTLPKGQYEYVVKATDDKETKTLLSKAFTVVASEVTEEDDNATDPSKNSTMVVSEYTCPVAIKEGNGFGVRGKITSNYMISSVSIAILDKDKIIKVSAEGTPNDKTYDLINLNSQIKFGGLKVGTYTYRIQAVDEAGKKTLLEKTFKVEGEEESQITISDYNYPAKLEKGKDFTIKGLINSNYNLGMITLKIYDDKGLAVLETSVNANALKYDLASLNSKVNFGTLKTGTYAYKVSANNDMETKTLIDKSFTVKTASKLGVSSYSYPKTLVKGEGFGVRGKITSNYTLSNVTIQITTTSAKEKLKVSVNPKAKTYDLVNLNNEVKFGGLSAGTYYYIVTATDTFGKKTLVKKKFTVYASNLKVKNYSYPVNVTYKKGFTLKGTITSNYNITKVIVGITKADGTYVTKVSSTPNKKSFSIASVDSKIKFGKLSKGTYIYKVEAKDKKQTRVLISKKFTVK